MGKKTPYTNITPLPSNIPRQLVIDMLHNHAEIIELNPLVIEHHPVQAPRKAAADEFFSSWYEITQRIDYMPGFSGKVNFKGVFHDMPYGLQTHVYAAMGVDIRNKWQVRGNQPGEPPEVRELGDSAPRDGLYLREDVEINCNRMLTPFVKKELKAATLVLVKRLMKKAELLDTGTLDAMLENGKLTTVKNPGLLPPDQSTSQNRFSTQLHYRNSTTSNRNSPLPNYRDSQGYDLDPTNTPNPMDKRQSQYEGTGPRQFVAELYGSDIPQQTQQGSPYPHSPNSAAFPRSPNSASYPYSPNPVGMVMELPGSTPLPNNYNPPTPNSSNQGNTGLGISSGSFNQGSERLSTGARSDRTSVSGSQYPGELA